MKIRDIKYILSIYPGGPIASIDNYIHTYDGKTDDTELSESEFDRLLCLDFEGKNDLWSIFIIYDLLNKSSLAVSPIVGDANIKTLFSLKKNKLSRLRHLLYNLFMTDQLDQNSFETTLEIIKSKLPPVETNRLTKFKLSSKRKLCSDNTSEMALDNNVHLFFSGKHMGEGGYGTIKKGYADPTDSEPIYALKESKLTDLEETRRFSKREVKYHRLLGRRACYVSYNNSSTAIFEWQKGQSLDSYTHDQLSAIPLKCRFKSTLSIASQLNILHKNHRVHGDIKITNVIFDPDADSLGLIDFGSAHKTGSRKWFSHTATVYDMFQTKQRLSPRHEFAFCDDMYSLGVVIARLFPELFQLKAHKLVELVVSDEFDRTFTVISDQITPSTSCHIRAIKMLVHAMSHDKTDHMEAVEEARTRQCTADDAVKFCIEVLNNWDNLDESLLNNIAKATIYHDKLTLADALRGHTNPTLSYSK